MNYRLAFKNASATTSLRAWFDPRQARAAEPRKPHESARPPSDAGQTGERFCSEWFAQRRWEDDGGGIWRANQRAAHRRVPS